MIGLFKSGQKSINATSPMHSRKSKSVISKAIRIRKKNNMSIDYGEKNAQFKTIANSSVRPNEELDI